MPKKIKVETPEQKAYRETVEKIAGNIAALAKAVSSLLNGPLKKRALIILLASSAKQPQERVEAILKALEDLESDWLNK
jgi:spore germination protein GerM